PHSWPFLNSLLKNQSGLKPSIRFRGLLQLRLFVHLLSEKGGDAISPLSFTFSFHEAPEAFQ
ncbi:MAG TPA: hypothetical protein VFG28_03130, partial [Syntrophales bacterium]|nr:hypothetical protein [Syntrophales bacterium]